MEQGQEQLLAEEHVYEGVHWEGQRAYEQQSSEVDKHEGVKVGYKQQGPSDMKQSTRWEMSRKSRRRGIKPYGKQVWGHLSGQKL